MQMEGDPCFGTVNSCSECPEKDCTMREEPFDGTQRIFIIRSKPRLHDLGIFVLKDRR